MLSMHDAKAEATVLCPTVQFKTKVEEDMKAMDLSQFVVYLKSLPIIRMEVQLHGCMELHMCVHAHVLLMIVYAAFLVTCLIAELIRCITSSSRSTWRGTKVKGAGLLPRSVEISVSYCRSSSKSEIFIGLSVSFVSQCLFIYNLNRCLDNGY